MELAAVCRAQRLTQFWVKLPIWPAPTPCEDPDTMQFVVRSWNDWPAGRAGAIAGVPATPPIPGTVVAGDDG